MKCWICYNAWSALIQKNYDMVEVLKFNVNATNKSLHADRNLCMDMENIGHKNETDIFKYRTKAFTDDNNKNLTIWCYYATNPDTKVNKPKGDMDIWVSEISND